jgi:hypothetical protein
MSSNTKNPRCPLPTKKACTGPLCGHCPACKDVWDNHNGLTTVNLACPKR